MGRIFCSIIEDSLGWHDTVGGNLSERGLREKYTVKTYGKPGMTGRAAVSTVLPSSWQNMGWGKDLAANLNLFSKVVTDEDGNMRYVPGHSSAGPPDLRFEMDTLVVLHTCPHPMNPDDQYPRKPIAYQIRKAAPVAEDDFCMNFRPENLRGFKTMRFTTSQEATNDRD